MTQGIIALDKVFCYAECQKQANHAEWHYAECHYAKSHYAECHYTECCYAECRGAIKLQIPFN